MHLNGHWKDQFLNSGIARLISYGIPTWLSNQLPVLLCNQSQPLKQPKSLALSLLIEGCLRATFSAHEMGATISPFVDAINNS